MDNDDDDEFALHHYFYILLLCYTIYASYYYHFFDHHYVLHRACNTLMSLINILGSWFVVSWLSVYCEYDEAQTG